MVLRAGKNMGTNERDQEQIQSIFRRIYDRPVRGELSARATYEIKRSILKKLIGRFKKRGRFS
jgi:hypothetical protein